MGKTLSWIEVAAVHGEITGISSIKGKGIVKSLLCNTGSSQKYPNKIVDNKIEYYVGPSTQTRGINALFNSLKKGNVFPVFRKLDIDVWELLGDFSIESVEEKKDGFYLFNLIASSS